MFTFVMTITTIMSAATIVIGSIARVNCDKATAVVRSTRNKINNINIDFSKVDAIFTEYKG